MSGKNQKTYTAPEPSNYAGPGGGQGTKLSKAVKDAGVRPIHETVGFTRREMEKLDKRKKEVLNDSNAGPATGYEMPILDQVGPVGWDNYDAKKAQAKALINSPFKPGGSVSKKKYRLDKYRK